MRQWHIRVTRAGDLAFVAEYDHLGPSLASAEAFAIIEVKGLGTGTYGLHIRERIAGGWAAGQELVRTYVVTGPTRSILHPSAPQRVILAACPACQKDHTSWTGCWLAELGSVLQDRGWSTTEIVGAMARIPGIQEVLYDAHIGPAVDAIEEHCPSAEELEAAEQKDREENGPSARDQGWGGWSGSEPTTPMSILDKDNL